MRLTPLPRNPLLLKDLLDLARKFLDHHAPIRRRYEKAEAHRLEGQPPLFGLHHLGAQVYLDPVEFFRSIFESLPEGRRESGRHRVTVTEAHLRRTVEKLGRWAHEVDRLYREVAAAIDDPDRPDFYGLFEHVDWPFDWDRNDPTPWIVETTNGPRPTNLGNASFGKAFEGWGDRCLGEDRFVVEEHQRLVFGLVDEIKERLEPGVHKEGDPESEEPVWPSMERDRLCYELYKGGQLSIKEIRKQVNDSIESGKIKGGLAITSDQGVIDNSDRFTKKMGFQRFRRNQKKSDGHV